MAYPIETLWALLKKNVKKRIPTTLDELKKFRIEEWNNIPQEYIKKLVKNYLKRIRKVIEIKGNRLEPYHLNEIRKEVEKEEEKASDEINDSKNKNMTKEEKRRILRLKIIYNDKNLSKLRKKEIKELKRQKKGVTQKYKTKKTKNVNLKKRVEKKDLDKKIEELKDMTLIEYLQHIRDEKEITLNWNKKYHTKSEEELEEDEETLDTIDKTINKILKLIRFIEKNKVKYKLAFKKVDYTWEEVKKMME